MSSLILPFGKDQKNRNFQLLPSEEERIYQCINSERESFQTQQAFRSVESRKDLISAVRGFANRLEQRIAEIGFKAVVSTDLKNPDNFDFIGDALQWHPRVEIMSRIDGDYNIDYDKAGYEVRHGLSDGRVGRIDEHGNWNDDPDRVHLIK